MKKVFALVLTLALLLAGLPPLHAQTEQHAELNVSFKPVENLEGSVVLEIDITVANGSPEQTVDLLEFRYENELIASVESISARSSAFARSGRSSSSCGISRRTRLCSALVCSIRRTVGRGSGLGNSGAQQARVSRQSRAQTSSRFSIAAPPCFRFPTIFLYIIP